MPARALWKAAVRISRDAWLVIGITLLLILALEGSLSLGSLIRDHLLPSAPHVVDRRLRADAYGKAPWIADYFKELHESSALRWEPFVYWRRKPYVGNYINVDADGLRRTPQSSFSEERTGRPLSVFMFGGSALWGTGARDSSTIPALVAAGLKRSGYQARVVNFAETGYVSTQEVVELLLQLRNGNVPDLVIFYDGANDTFSAYQLKTAGLPMNEFNRTAEFNLTKPDRFKDLMRVVVRERLDELSAVRLLQSLLRSLGLMDRHQAAGESRSTDAVSTSAETELAQEVVDVYLNNMRLVRALGAAYGFECFFYWQPTIFGKERLSQYEKGALAEEERSMVEFFEETYDRMHRIGAGCCGGDRVRDLGPMLAGISDPLYIDWVHLGERGNGMITQKMLDDLLPGIQAMSPRVKRATSPGSAAGPPRPSIRPASASHPRA